MKRKEGILNIQRPSSIPAEVKGYVIDRYKKAFNKVNPGIRVFGSSMNKEGRVIIRISASKFFICAGLQDPAVRMDVIKAGKATAAQLPKFIGEKPKGGG